MLECLGFPWFSHKPHSDHIVDFWRSSSILKPSPVDDSSHVKTKSCGTKGFEDSGHLFVSNNSMSCYLWDIAGEWRKYVSTGTLTITATCLGCPYLGLPALHFFSTQSEGPKFQTPNMKTDPGQNFRPWHFWDLADAYHFVAFLHLMPCRLANVLHPTLSGDVGTTVIFKICMAQTTKMTWISMVNLLIKGHSNGFFFTPCFPSCGLPSHGIIGSLWEPHASHPVANEDKSKFSSWTWNQTIFTTFA